MSRRVRRKGFFAACSETPTVADPSFHAAFHKRTAVWLLRVMDLETTDDSRFYECAAWCVGGLKKLAQELCRRLPTPKGKGREATVTRDNLRLLAQTQSRHIDNALERMVNEDRFFHEAVLAAIREILEEAAKVDAPSLGKVMGKIGKVFGLGEDALELCAFAFCLGNYGAIEHYFEDELDIHNFENVRLMAKTLNISASAYSSVYSTLRKINIIDIEYGSSLRLNSSVEDAVRDENCKNVSLHFCQPLKRSTVPMEHFRLDPDDKAHVLRLLQARNSNPAHILLYGAPGGGKTSFASTLAQTLGVKAWAIPCRENDRGDDRRVAIEACLRLSARHPRSFIVVDEAERLLDTDMERRGSAKAWLNELLERKGARIIWILNDVSQLDHAVRRRFSYSLYFANPGRSEREIMWDMILKKIGAESRLSPETRERFAALYPVPAATIENAVRQAKSLNVGADFENYVERYLKSQMILRHDGNWLAPASSARGVYDPDAVATKLPLERIVKNVRDLAAKLERADDLAPGYGSMLFWGPSGTGKTAFGKYLADELGYELLSYKASDLLGMFVGESEKLIDEAFAAGSRPKTLLLIDEVDSFLLNRESAQRSWEQTMVNEFLTQLENFRGLCVCSTNFRKALDPAAMRRFSYKVEFVYATPEKAERLYARLLASLAELPLSEEQTRRLRGMKNLAPGDFAAVRKQYFLDAPVEPGTLLDALDAERRLKLEGESSTLGF